MKYDVLRTEKDMSGKIRVWVDTGNKAEVQVLKFSQKPTLTEIKTAIDKVKEPTKEEQIIEIDNQIKFLSERKIELEKTKDVIADS